MILSVVMPVGRVDGFLVETLMSVQAQIFKDFELIVVCDVEIFDDVSDLNKYISLIEKWKSLNEQNIQSSLPGKLVETLDPIISLNLLCSWKGYIPEPWHAVYSSLLSSCNT